MRLCIWLKFCVREKSAWNFNFKFYFSRGKILGLQDPKILRIWTHGLTNYGNFVNFTEVVNSFLLWNNIELTIRAKDQDFILSDHVFFLSSRNTKWKQYLFRLETFTFLSGYFSVKLYFSIEYFTFPTQFMEINFWSFPPY